MPTAKLFKPEPNFAPRDRLRGRRIKKLLANIVVISVLSIGTAFVMTRQTKGPGFSLPTSGHGADAATLPSTGGTELHSAVSADQSASTAEAAVDGYKLETGPLAVTEVSDAVLHDAKRNKDVHVRIFYPVTTGKYPVVVFSHGAGGSENCCDALTRHWASYGYVTLQPTHDDSMTQRNKGGEENLRFFQAVREALKKPALWESRPQDIAFLLDSLPELQKRIGGLAGKMDSDRIGVTGHSMGSYTAEAMAGALVDLPGHPGTNFSDPRVKAVLCLSPQGPGQFGLTTRSFDKMSLPFMGVTGSQDNLGPLANAAWHKIPFERSQAGDKYEVFITGANHMSFITDETLMGKHSSQAAAILGYTNSASLAFLDAYLKGDAGAKQFLHSDALERSSHGAAKLSRR